MKIFKNLFLILPVFLIACGTPNVYPGHPNYPQINPDSQHSFLLHGKLEPSLHIKFNIRWEARNPQCEYTVNTFEGASGLNSINLPLDVHQEGEKFQARVVTDAFLKGDCDWEFDHISYSGIPKGRVVANAGYPFSKPHTPANEKLSLYCLPQATWTPNSKDIVCTFKGKRYAEALSVHQQTQNIEINILKDPSWQSSNSITPVAP